MTVNPTLRSKVLHSTVAKIAELDAIKAKATTLISKLMVCE